MTLVPAIVVVMMFNIAAAFALSVSAAAISFTGVTLDGTNQTTAGTTSAWRVDANGEASGCNMTVSSTDFTNGGSGTIDVSNFDIRLQSSNIVLVSGDPTGPTSTQTTFAALSGTPLKIASAASGDGDGVYDLTPDFQLSVPAETFTGSYSATVTVTVSSGP